MNDPGNKTQTATAKAVLYGNLAQAFNYPDEGLVQALTDGKFLQAGTTMLPAEALDLLKPLDAYRGVDGDKLLLDLERDYTWMFFASKPRIAYLFESVYSEGKLYQESTFQIARLYHAAGLKVEEAFKLPPDHIAVEFEFMAYLAFNEVEAIDKGNGENEKYARQLQEEVLAEHLKPLAFALGERICEKAKTDFYRTMGRFLMQLFHP